MKLEELFNFILFIFENKWISLFLNIFSYLRVNEVGWRLVRSKCCSNNIMNKKEFSFLKKIYFLKTKNNEKIHCKIWYDFCQKKSWIYSFYFKEASNSEGLPPLNFVTCQIIKNFFNINLGKNNHSRIVILLLSTMCQRNIVKTNSLRLCFEDVPKGKFCMFFSSLKIWKCISIGKCFFVFAMKLLVLKKEKKKSKHPKLVLF